MARRDGRRRAKKRDAAGTGADDGATTAVLCWRVSSGRTARGTGSCRADGRVVIRGRVCRCARVRRVTARPRRALADGRTWSRKTDAGVRARPSPSFFSFYPFSFSFFFFSRARKTPDVALPPRLHRARARALAAEKKKVGRTGPIPYHYRRATTAVYLSASPPPPPPPAPDIFTTHDKTAIVCEFRPKRTSSMRCKQVHGDFRMKYIFVYFLTFGFPTSKTCIYLTRFFRIVQVFFKKPSG